MAEARLLLTPNIPTALPLEIEMGSAPADGIFLGEGPESLQLPIPTYEEEYAESGETEGGGRLRSRPTNPTGTVGGFVSGSTVASSWENASALQQTIEMCRRHRGYLT